MAAANEASGSSGCLTYSTSPKPSSVSSAGSLADNVGIALVQAMMRGMEKAGLHPPTVAQSEEFFSSKESMGDSGPAPGLAADSSVAVAAALLRGALREAILLGDCEEVRYR